MLPWDSANTMKYRRLLPLTISIAAVILAGGVARPATPAQGTGSINAGKRVFQEAVLTTADGGLINAFVNLKGSFPQTPVPSKPVVLDQRGN
jgi:hypothetical protein